MEDIVGRVARMEREIRIWRIAALAGFVVLACEGDEPSSAQRGTGEFTSITVASGSNTVVIDPHVITMRDAEGNESRLWATSLDLRGKDSDGNDKKTTLMNGQLSLDDGGPQRAAVLAAGRLWISAENAGATLRADQDGSQLLLESDLTGPKTTAVLSSRPEAANLRLSYVPAEDVGRGSLSVESAAAGSSVWMIDDHDRQLTVTPEDGVGRCTPKPNAPCR